MKKPADFSHKKTPVDHRNSDKIGSLFTVVGPYGWLTLLAVILFISAISFWGLWGSVTQSVSADCIIVSDRKEARFDAVIVLSADQANWWAAEKPMSVRLISGTGRDSHQFQANVIEKRIPMGEFPSEVSQFVARKVEEDDLNAPIGVVGASFADALDLSPFEKSSCIAMLGSRELRPIDLFVSAFRP